MANFRSRDLLNLAHAVKECQCCGRAAPYGCEPAHANWSEFGKGMGLKAHDVFHAAMHHDCHARLDQGSDETRDERYARWLRAYINTQLLYWSKGWVRIA